MTISNSTTEPTIATPEQGRAPDAVSFHAAGNALEPAAASIPGQSHMAPQPQMPVAPSPRAAEPAPPRGVDWENPRVTAILTAAAKCFAQKGFSATTLAEIGKELGLRKSIVHYYFASKSALIHEVQSFTYHKYLEQMRQAMTAATDGAGDKLTGALKSLWETVQSNQTGTGLNIEVWSASRLDDELKRRAAALHRDAQQLISQTLSEVSGGRPEQTAELEALSTLTLAVVNGLSVTGYLEGDSIRVQKAYDTFLGLLKTRVGSMASGS